jgi:hypothetical protein
MGQGGQSSESDRFERGGRGRVYGGDVEGDDDGCRRGVWIGEGFTLYGVSGEGDKFWRGICLLARVMGADDEFRIAVDL